MRVTKYEHACLDIEDNGRRLIVDPGSFTTSLTNFANICAVIITHKHPDHFNIELIDNILSANPGITIYTTSDTANELGERKYEVVRPNESFTCDEFHVSFYGGKHAVIHPDLPEIENIGILVNERLYYPGDTLTIPNQTVKLLAVPAIAPWMKISETMDFIMKLKAERLFPTHNSLLSDNGHKIYNGRLNETANAAGSEFVYLEPGQTIEV